MKRYAILFITAISFFSIAFNPAQSIPVDKVAWIEYQFQQLTLEERIGQLFMVAAYSNQGEKHHEFIENLIKRYNIGGLIFFQGDPISQAKLTNQYQQKAKTPLLLAIDAEWGLGMRLTNTISYPRQMTLGAIQDHQLIYEMGSEIARQLKLLGLHINLAPVIDINTNPDNPGIGNRAFGDGKGSVTSKGLAYIQGLQDNGIMAVAKHFPGKGDASKDAHHELPTISHDITRLEAIELYPFKKAIRANIGGIMVSHLYLPAYDKTTNRAASLSPHIVTQLLRNKLGFKGLIFTDALNMKAVSKYYQPGEVDLLALQAGNDILLFPEDVPKAIALIKSAIEQGKLTKEVVEEKVKKILAVKYQMNLHQWKPIEIDGLCEQLNTPEAQVLKQKLFEQAITLVANQDDLIPITKLNKHKIASLSIIKQPITLDAQKLTNQQNLFTATPKPVTIFGHSLSQHAPVTHYKLNRTSLDVNTLQQLADELENYTLVIVDLHDLVGNRANKFGLQPELLNFLNKLQHTNTKVLMVVFGSVYSLELFQNMNHIIAAYQDDPIAEQVVPQIIFGALPAVGNLPVSIPNAWKSEWGIRTKSIKRLGYALPEAVQMNSRILQGIDKVIEAAILEEVMPGCQVLVARNGKIIFEKAYGYHTYTKKIPVTNTTLYDIASITKVVGPLQAIMYLVSQNKLDITQKVSTYLPELFATNKKNLTIKSVLAHQAGLLDCGIASSILFQKDSKLSKKLFSNYPSASYPNRIGADLYAPHLLKELMWDLYINAPVKERGKSKKSSKIHGYHYNDLSFHIMHRLIEKLLQQPMEIFLTNKFYQSLGAGLIGYNPLERVSLHQIAPTAECDFFRTTPIHGIVHDPQAAICGGVAGNAGLFSNAHDLAIILQMNLQGGYYGGKRYLKKKVIQQFTSQAFKNNRRGLGWDKPELSTKIANDKHKPNTSLYASAATYGHLGFTGTAAWVDPQYNLLYIILSNRTYPTQENNKLAEQNIRIKLQDIVYQALQDVE
jgi:beta-glucosidase-like glycosyl hydrolase/CubicO group peptidase (beta-lactamase class C family)